MSQHPRSKPRHGRTNSGQLDQLAAMLANGEPAEHRNPWTALAGLLAVAAVAGIAIAVVAALVLGSVAMAGTRAVKDTLAGNEHLVEPPLPGKTEVLDRNGNPIAILYTYDRVPVGSDGIADVAKQAVIATEDVRYMQHAGVDWQGLARALVSNAAGNQVQGGSGITQQYVKNARVLQALVDGDFDAASAATEQTAQRKLQEIRLALDLEKRLPKQEILARYLNIAYFGQGAYGIEAAARRYYSTSASQLNLNQAATLAGLLQAPDLYDPIRRPERAQARRDTVLQRMQAAGFIDADTAQGVSSQPLLLNPSRPRQGCLDAAAGFYCDAVRRALLESDALGPSKAERKARLVEGGLTVRTNLDPQLQRQAIKAARSAAPASHRVAVGIAVVEPGTGNVLALASNRGFGSGAGQTEVPLLTVRTLQPASTFKVFTLAAALENGWDIDARLPGGSTYTSQEFDNPDDGSYQNIEGISGSNITIVDGTRWSLNTAYIQLAERVGLPAAISMAQRFGIKVPDDISPRSGMFVLGSYETSVLDMAAAYAGIAAGGLYCKPALIASITDKDGNEILSPPQCRQVLTPAVAGTISAILQQVIENGTGRSARLTDRPAAGKTGTSSTNGAAWFAGYTPQYATVVWMGDPRGGPGHPLVNTLGLSRVYGGTLPAAAWKQVMEYLHRGKQVLAFPPLNKAYLLDPVPSGSNDLVPALAGLPTVDAVALLRARGWNVTVQGNGPTVTAVTPDPGTPIAAGSSITVQAR